jgi:sarcosine oxidase
MDKPFDVAIVGAGVFGAWIARHLLDAGQRVLLVDQYGAASARASSGGETRVIRMAYGPDEVYTRMSAQSLPQWQALFARLGRPELFRNTGVLWLSVAGHAAAAQSLALLARHGIAHERLDGDALARRYPQLTVPPGGWGLLEPDSGALLARRAVQALVDDCVQAGATLRIAKVSPPRGDGRIAQLACADGEPVRADRYVFAGGPWLGRLLPDVLGGRIFPTRQEVFYVGRAPGDRAFAPPALPIWLDFERDWYGFPDLDGRGFKLAHDSHGEAVDPDTQSRVPTPARIAQARDFLARRFPALADAPIVGTEVCQYENTSNGDFVLDQHPAFANAWIAGGGSGHGFKHGPAVGAYVAARMLHEAAVEPRFGLVTKADVQRREVH